MLPAAALPVPRKELFFELKSRLHAAPGATQVSLENLVPTAVEALDALLGGGLPKGALVTLEGPCSSGRWSIVASLLAAVTRRALGAIIDDGELYPPTLEEAGVRLDRLLVVPAKTPTAIARAVDALLRSRVARVVVMGGTALRAPIWSRLAHLASRMGVVLIVVTMQAAIEVSVVASVRIACAFHRVLLRGTRGLWCHFSGFELRAHLCKQKQPMIGRGTTSNHVVVRAYS
jgi:hypothetical protein